MADLGGTLPGDDRGQIILIAAFILAVSFVVLALVVNSAIFTENLSTRDDVAGSQDALEYRAELKAGVESLVESVNENASLSPLDVDASVQNMSAQSGLSQARLGRIVNVSVISKEYGQRIAQDNASRNFTSNGSAADWTVVSGVSETRNFVINVTNPNSSINFDVLANQSGGPPEWEMTIDTNGDFTVSVETSTNSETPPCTRSPGSHVIIDVTDATVDGEPCHALYRNQSTGDKMWFAEGLSDYDIEFDDGDEIEGTYSLIVDETASINASNYHGPPNDDYPYAQEDPNDIIWSSTIKYSYLTSSLAYQTEIEAAPGELPP